MVIFAAVFFLIPKKAGKNLALVPTKVLASILYHVGADQEQ